MKHKRMKTCIFSFFFIFTTIVLHAEDGHKLWFRAQSTSTVNVVCSNSSPIIENAKQELQKMWQGNSGETIVLQLVENKQLQSDGLLISDNSIQANTKAGFLYGAFEMLRKQQTNSFDFNGIFNPSYDLRILNHWDKSESFVGTERFTVVQKKLREQSLNTQQCKDACFLYFQHLINCRFLTVWNVW